MLTYAAEGQIGWMYFARAATWQAIHRHEERVFNPARKDHHWGQAEAGRVSDEHVRARLAAAVPAAREHRRLRRETGFCRAKP